MKITAYQKIVITTIIATALLILIGSLVRVSGAGLGCPDWPKCFGLWIPPTTVEELPPQFDASQFNVTLTWIEYINRLVGVLIGFLILLTFGFSLKYRRTNKPIFYASTVAFILVLIQGWLGKIVVETELHEGMITVHMMVALLILTTLTYACFKSFEKYVTLNLNIGFRKVAYVLSIILIGLTFVQVFLGTRVREGIDFITNNMPQLDRAVWLLQEHVTFLHEVHRSSSWLILIVMILMSLQFKKNSSPSLQKLFYSLWLLILSQIVFGVILAYGSMPPMFQVLHLANITLIVFTEVWMFLILNHAKVLK